MKNWLLLVVCVFFTYTTFAQTERDDKVQKRVERDNPKPPVVVNPSTQPLPPRTYYNPNPYYYNRDPFYNPYRGGWNNPRRSFYRPRYSTPNYSYGKIESEPRNSDEIFGIGLDLYVTRTTPMFGAQGFVGGKEAYWLFGLAFSPVNPFSHFDNITLSDVLRWEDEYVRTYRYNQIFQIGGGFRIGEIFYPRITLGGFTQKDYLVYYDELNILTQSGNYSINGGKTNSFIMDVGLNVHQQKWFISTSTGIVGPKRFSVGLGLLFGD